MQRAIAAGADLLFRLDEAMLAGEMFGECSAVVVARRPRLIFLFGLLALGRRPGPRLVLGVDGGQRLGQVFEGELQLIGGEPFGTAAELVALQLDDDGAQPVAFGVGVFELGFVIVALGLVVISLGLQR